MRAIVNHGSGAGRKLFFSGQNSGQNVARHHLILRKDVCWQNLRLGGRFLRPSPVQHQSVVYGRNSEHLKLQFSILELSCVSDQDVSL
jgi:hypothetical protein